MSDGFDPNTGYPPRPEPDDIFSEPGTPASEPDDIFSEPGTPASEPDNIFSEQDAPAPEPAPRRFSFGAMPDEDLGDDPFSHPEQYEEPEPPKGTPWIIKLPLTLLILAICGFAVFCIVWDIQKGTSGGGYYRAGDIVQVELVQAHKNSDERNLQDSSGKYTPEGIAETVMPSIVQIYTYSDSRLAGTGSGIILSDKGFIATNAHVVNGGDAFRVRLYDETGEDSGETFDALLIGHDTKTDLAIIKISADNLTPATLGDSSEVRLGEQVCALGNPAGLTSSISLGIISGMNRKIRAESTNFEMDCFQTDAAISPGNSGGALVDMDGHVIGITSSKYGSNSIFESGKYEGLGFAIKINEALPILTELMEQGYVSGRVRIGIQFLSNENAHLQAEDKEQKLPSDVDGKGILIMSIAEDSDLKRTELQPGDWILSMEGQQVSDYDDVNAAINGKVGGDTVHCRCGRIEEDGKFRTFDVVFRLLEDQSGEY